MTILDAAKILKAEVLVEGDACGIDFQHVVASDLMSDVLLVDEEDILILTSLASDQVVRTSQIIGAVGVIVVNGKTLPSSMTKVAEDLGVSLARCDHSKFDACVAVHESM